MKLTKRKGFNFFRSYYDVYNELNDKDKIAFIDALFDRQFQGIKPTDINGMAKFAYISQTNSIDSQVRGYEDKTKTRLDGSLYIKGIEPPTQPPTVGATQPPTLQEEEKGEVKVKEKEKVILNLEERKLKFATSLKQYLGKYSRDMLIEFTDYWTEHGENDKKMRFEKQRSFSKERRLRTWNSNNFNNNRNGSTKHQQLITEIRNENPNL